VRLPRAHRAPQRANLRRAATLPSLAATDSSVIAAADADATQQFRGLRDGRGRKCETLLRQSRLALPAGGLTKTLPLRLCAPLSRTRADIYFYM